MFCGLHSLEPGPHLLDSLAERVTRHPPRERLRAFNVGGPGNRLIRTHGFAAKVGFYVWATHRHNCFDHVPDATWTPGAGMKNLASSLGQGGGQMYEVDDVIDIDEIPGLCAAGNIWRYTVPAAAHYIGGDA